MKPFPIEKIIASFEEKFSVEDKAELENWLGKSNKNRQYYNETKKVYETSIKVRLNFYPNENAALKKVNRRLFVKQTVRWSYRVAAAFILVFFVTKVLLHTQQTQWNEITTENKQTIYLSDSSKVILAENTRFKYPDKFEDNQRFVYLTGKAYFEVARNQESPFTLETANTKIEVLGTRFLVDGANSTIEKVIVDEGKVAFSSISASTKPVILTTAEVGTWTATTNNINERIIADKNSNAWLSSRLTFKDMPIWQLIETFEKHFKIKIELADEQYAQLRFTGDFNSATPEEALKVVCLAVNLNFEETEDKYIIKP